MGALTNKLFAFKARPWELKNINTFDFLEPAMCQLLYKFYNQVVRILPRSLYRKNNGFRSCTFAFDG